MVFIQKIFDAILAPFAGLAPIWGLGFATLLITAFALIVYKYTSNQEGIKRAKERIKAHFVEVWLFIDDPILILKAQGGIFKNGALYLAYAIVPLLIMILPVLLFLVNCEYRYHYRSFEKGEQFLLKVRVSELPDWMNALELNLPQTLELTAPPLRIKDEDEKGREFREIDFRIKVKEKGTHSVKLILRSSSTGSEQVEIKIFAQPDKCIRLNPLEGAGFGLNFWHPGYGWIKSGIGIEQIEITYPHRDVSFFGWKTWWVWPMIILMFIFAFALKPIIKVEF